MWTGFHFFTTMIFLQKFCIKTQCRDVHLTINQLLLWTIAYTLWKLKPKDATDFYSIDYVLLHVSVYCIVHLINKFMKKSIYLLHSTLHFHFITVSFMLLFKHIKMQTFFINMRSQRCVRPILVLKCICKRIAWFSKVAVIDSTKNMDKWNIINWL